MARKRTAPRRRRTAAAKRATTAAPPAQALAAPADTRLTDRALRAHVRKTKPAYDIFSTFGSGKAAAEEKMEQIRASMR